MENDVCLESPTQASSPALEAKAEAQLSLPLQERTDRLGEDQKEKRRQYYLKWRDKNKDSIREYNRNYRLSHRDDLIKKGSEWRKEHRFDTFVTNREYYRTHREQILFKKKEYSVRTREKKKAYASINGPKYYSKNKDRIRKEHKEYRMRRPEVFRAASMLRRARARNATIEKESVVNLIKKWRTSKTFKCYYCEKTFPIKKMTIDHISPLSRGGSHSVSNLCRCCLLCNNKKFVKPIHKVVVNGQPFLI